MKQTTRVFACWRHLHSLIDAASWPPSARADRSPAVIFGDFADPPLEAVIVIGVPTDRPNAEWATYGAPSQDEQFVLQVWISTRLPGMENLEALDRLEALCDVVQGELRDQTTGRPKGDFNAVIPGVISHAVTQISPTIFPTKEGFCGFAELNVLFKARI
jgi:hypothetical protein